MDIFFTCTESINGLKHFVIVNIYKVKSKYFFELVSVLDDQIRIKISETDFRKSNKWKIGWSDDEKFNVLLNEYKKFKLNNSKKNGDRVFLKDSSPFNIS
tara:strand:- start:882 stop:1181 length:300 start_codon:yes stop_codon:yes gene_type:complete